MKAIHAILLFITIGITTTGCTEVSRGLGKLTDNKYAEPRSGSVWAVPPPQLEPVSQNRKNVYISFRNISDSDIDLTSQLKQAATDQGWTIVTDPAKATYRLRASLRFWGEVEPETGGATKAATMGLISGAAVGLGTAGALSSSGANNLGSAAGGVAVGGLVGAGMVNGATPREWALICDFVLEERLAKPVSYQMARSDSSSTVAGGGVSNSRTAAGGGTKAGNTTSGTITKTSNYFPHGIRLSVWSNQMNMSEAEALPGINQRLAKVVKQMLPI
ncbi:MAG: complement resistance protein TraT [Gammaproteobacteria bacterium]|nr:complement resistance protein TraT [Gammaproteobacteria bacterium]